MYQNLKETVLRVPFTGEAYRMLLTGRYFFRWFLGDYASFVKRTERSKARFTNKITDWSPKLWNKTSTTEFDSHYTYFPAWAARTVITQIRPKSHVDISSTLHFCTVVSSVIPVKFYDYRPAPLRLPNLTSESGDLMNLPFETGSVESISCMHVIEHIGLGRYGDPIDPDGDIKSINELKRVVAPGGSVLFVVPVGRPKIEFNAHRIYSYEQIVEYFLGMELKEFSLVPDNYVETGLIVNADPSLVQHQTWGCGCFWFKKPLSP
jgi:hypothetical protein